jgi:hypothetical protein
MVPGSGVTTACVAEKGAVKTPGPVIVASANREYAPAAVNGSSTTPARMPATTSRPLILLEAMSASIPLAIRLGSGFTHGARIRPSGGPLRVINGMHVRGNSPHRDSVKARDTLRRDDALARMSILIPQ